MSDLTNFKHNVPSTDDASVNSAFSHGDVSSTRPRVTRSRRIKMSAPFGTSTWGSHVVPFMCEEYIAGTQYHSIKIDFLNRIQPIVRAVHSSLDINFYVVYVPNTAVMNNYQRFSSQRYAVGEDEQATLPNGRMFNTSYGSHNPPRVMPIGKVAELANLSYAVPLVRSTLFRDTIFSHYYGPTIADTSASSGTGINLLPIRGYKHACNRIFRDKTTTGRYSEIVLPYISQAEHTMVFRYGKQGAGSSLTDSDLISSDFVFPESELCRCQVDQTYLNDFRLDVVSDNNPVNLTTLQSHVITQQAIDEYRSRSENVNKTDEEVIAELRGTYVAKENIPYVIAHGSRQIDMKVQLNTSQGELDLAAEGAVSYTFGNESLNFHNFSAPIDGYIHYFYTITTRDAAQLLTAAPRFARKVRRADYYRPSYRKMKDDVKYAFELNNFSSDLDAAVGYHRKFSEYATMTPYFRGDFIEFNRSWSEPASVRDPVNGYIPSDYTSNKALPWTDSDALPSQSIWLMNNSATRLGPDNLIHVKKDYTDYFMRNILLNNKPSLSHIDWKRSSNHTFYMTGTVSVEKSLPIPDDILDDVIHYGDE